nr:unnamed protein product [Digitaria exilis]
MATSSLPAATPLRLRLRSHASAPRAPPLRPRPVVTTATSAKRSSLRFAGVRCAIDGAEALRSEVEPPAASVPRSVPVRLAYELQQAGHRYLDVRTEGMTKNTHFVEQVSRIFGKDDEIIVGCQSGKRSLMAATELCSAGFTAVTDIAGGFSSWRENGLPTAQ